VLNRLTDYVFKYYFSVADFTLQPVIIKIGEISMRHRMTAKLKSQGAELSQLRCLHIAACPEKLDRYKEGGIESGVLQDWHCADEI